MIANKIEVWYISQKICWITSKLALLNWFFKPQKFFVIASSHMVSNFWANCNKVKKCFLTTVLHNFWNHQNLPKGKSSKQEMFFQVFVLSLLVCQSYQQDYVISGYGPVSLEDLHPLTLSWNQVWTKGGGGGSILLLCISFIFPLPLVLLIVCILKILV